MNRYEIREYVESKIVPPFKIVMGNGLATPAGIFYWDDNFDAVAVLIGRYDNSNVTCLSVSTLEQLQNDDDAALKKLLDLRLKQALKTWELYLEEANDVSA